MSELVIDTKGLVNILNNSGESIGTGFFVSDKCIVTCCHVLEEIDGSLYQIDSVNYQIANTTFVFKSKLEFFDKDKDVALLIIDSKFGYSYKLTEQVLTNGESLSTVGFPLGENEYLFSHPCFMGLINDSDLQLGNANEIVPGFSGAPLFNSSGQVVGMISSYVEENKGRLTNVAKAVSANIILNVYKQINDSSCDYLNSSKKQGISEYKRFIKGKTDCIGFKGIESIASKNTKTLQFYAHLYVRDMHSISDSNTSLYEFACAERGIIIKGEPGSGKSTFIKYMVRSELEKNSNIVPFVISLESFGKFIEKKEPINMCKSADLLIEYILQEYPQKRFYFDKNTLDEIFTQGLGWIFFDGFDEIDSNDAKNKVITLINFVFDYWECKILVTTRPYAIDEYNSLKDFQTIYIDCLHMRQIEEYISNFAKIIDVNQYLIDANGLINIIRSNPAINDLSRTPVMLTFICLIYFVKDEIPESRYEIIDKIIKWLIETKYSSIDKQEEIIRKYASIAFDMFSSSSPQKEIESNKLLLYADSQSKDAFFNSLNKVGIIIKCGGTGKSERYSFWHFCFEEYLTAKSLCNYSPYDYNYLLNKWFDKEWQEVIVFYSACLLNTENAKIINFVNKICDFLLSLDLVKCIKGTSLLGIILKEIYPQISFLNNTNFNKLKERVKIVFVKDLPEISVIDKCNAAIAYGLGGDERFFDFDRTFSKINSGYYYIGAQNRKNYRRKFDPKATEFECPVKKIFLNEFEIRKYPITVQEYEEFIQKGGYSASKEIWTEEGLIWRNNNEVRYPRNWRKQMYLRNSPVTGISWYEAVAYCNWLTATSHDKYIYYLPTESQWEYSYASSYNINNADNQKINCYIEQGDIQMKTPVGIFPESTSQNGMTDMLGNVEEWCADSWHMSLSLCPKDGSALVDPDEIGAVTRGGSTIRTKRLCRYTYRARCNKNTRYDTIGFRVVRQERL